MEYQYYGLFLTDKSKDILLNYLFDREYKDHKELKWSEPILYLDHCTLLHRSQEEEFPEIKETLDNCITSKINITSVIVDGIGISDKAMAFRVNPFYLCANKIPHITICTYNNGSPKDSNDITIWENIDPIEVETILKIVE